MPPGPIRSTVNYTTFNNTGYFSDTNDAGNSGNCNVGPRRVPVLGAPTSWCRSLISNRCISIHRGWFTVNRCERHRGDVHADATDIGAATQIVGDNGFATTTFGGYQRCS